MYVHSQEPGGQDNASYGATDQQRVNGDVNLCVLDQAEGSVFRGVPGNLKV